MHNGCWAGYHIQSALIIILRKVQKFVKRYIPSNSNIAKRREEDIAAGKPVSDNIQVIDVEALQQQLFRQAKEKYKNHAFVKVMNETLRKKAENEKKLKSEETTLK